jgi:hypothetical protein
MYSGASATLDVDGQLIGASMVGDVMKGSIEIQRGVLQGSPISPLLFNLFLDSVVRSVHDDNDADSGIPLPRVNKASEVPWPRASGPSMAPPPPAAPAPGQAAPLFVPCDTCGFSVSPQFMNAHVGSRQCKRHLNNRLLGRQPRGTYGSQPAPGQDAAGAGHDQAQNEAGERLRSAWYADDGAGITRTHAAMQRMIEKLMDRFAELGLVLNAGKTHVLMVPPCTWTYDQYVAARNSAITQGFFAKRSNETGGARIKVVDEFTYLGVEVTWRWDWKAAWKAASARAWRMFFVLRNGGLGNSGASMASMLHAVKSLIFCHLDAVAAMAGSLDDEAMEEGERVITAALMMITDAKNANKEALRIEAGIWDFRTRVQMLQLRFACKTSTADEGTLQGRAFAQCRERLRLDAYAMSHPAYAYKQTERTRSWAQSVAVAARRFDTVRSAAEVQADPRPSLEQAIFDGKPGLALATVERSHDANGVVWTVVTAGTLDVAGQKLRLRSVFEHASARDFVDGTDVSSWELPEGSRIAAALCTWSPPLREVVKVSLKREGNVVRQRDVSLRLRGWATKTLLREYVMWKRSSYLESYWFCSDVAAARRLLRARLGCWGDELSTRYKPCGVLPQVARADRACYLCAEADWMPESLEHLVLSCPHAAMVDRRARIRSALTDLAETVADVALNAAADSDSDVLCNAPDFSDDGALMVCLMLGTSHFAKPLRAAPAVAAPAVAGDIASRRQAYQNMQYSDAAVETIKWVNALTSYHRRALSTLHGANRLAPLGAQLVEIACGHWADLWRRRRTLLAHADSGFALRTRDPPAARQLADARRKQASAEPAQAAAQVPRAARPRAAAASLPAVTAPSR